MARNNTQLKTDLSKALAALCLMVMFITNGLAQTAPSSPVATDKQPTAATTPAKTPPPASGYQSPKIGGVTFSGSLRLRSESWDWFDTKAADDAYTFGAAVLRLSLGQQKEKI